MVVSKHILTIEPKTDLKGSFDICIPTKELERIAKEMVDQPIYDGKGYSVTNIIGRIISAKVEGSKVVYKVKTPMRGN